MQEELREKDEGKGRRRMHEERGKEGLTGKRISKKGSRMRG